MTLAESEFLQMQNGALVFARTDINITILFNYLKAGKTTEDFLDDYPQVSLENVLNLLETAEAQLHQSLSI